MSIKEIDERMFRFTSNTDATGGPIIEVQQTIDWLDVKDDPSELEIILDSDTKQPTEIKIPADQVPTRGGPGRKPSSR